MTISLDLWAQSDVPTTNDGEEFVDPFADPEASEPEPQPQPAPAPPPEPQPAPAVDQAEPATPAPVPAPAPAPSPSLRPSGPQIQTPSDNFNMPAPEPEQGPADQEFTTKAKFQEGTAKGTWFLDFSTGGGFNIQRRPNQLHHEIEGGRRLFKQFELSGVLYWRHDLGFDERNLGLLVYPSWTFRLNKGGDKRFDLRTGIGTGWILTGIRGSDFQLGYFPIRLGANLIAYGYANFAIFFGADLEFYLFTIDTDGNYEGLLGSSEGVPTQAMAQLGVRFEF